MFEKINKILELYVIFAGKKVIKMPEFLLYLPEY